MDHCIKITWGVVTKTDSWAISPVYWIRFLIREIPWNCSYTHHAQVTVINNKALLLFSHSIVSDSLRLHELQHARLPCPSLSPRVCSNSCPLSQWCHPTISSSVAPFSSCPQSFSASGSSTELAFWIRWPKYWSFSLKSFIHWKDWWILKWVVVIWMYIRVDSHSDVCLRSSHFLHVNYTTGKNIKGCSLTLAGRQLILAWKIPWTEEPGGL